MDTGTSTRTLDIFNFSGAQVRDANGVFGQTSIQTGDSGIGVVNSNGQFSVADGKPEFDAALIATTQNSDILDYVYYDGSNPTPTAPFDFDLLFFRAFEASDAFLIQERWGNTYFAVDPLGADGNPIVGANKLVFGGNTDADPFNTGSAHERYDWDSGFGLGLYQSSQTIGFTVVEASMFFDDTSIDPEDQIVYGFRVKNEGNADVKFFGLSDDTFDNNPINPLIPEPSTSVCLLGGLGFILLLRLR